MKLHSRDVFVSDLSGKILAVKFIPIVGCDGSASISISMTISLYDYNTLIYLHYCWMEIYVFSCLGL